MQLKGYSKSVTCSHKENINGDVLRRRECTEDIWYICQMATTFFVGPILVPCVLFIMVQMITKVNRETD